MELLAQRVEKVNKELEKIESRKKVRSDNALKLG